MRACNTIWHAAKRHYLLRKLRHIVPFASGVTKLSSKKVSRHGTSKSEGMGVVVDGGWWMVDGGWWMVEEVAT